MTSSNRDPDHPDFSHWSHRGRWNQGDWRRRRRFLFLRFGRFLMVGLVVFLAGIGGIAFLITRVLGGTTHDSLIVWLISAGLIISFPIFLGIVAMRTFFRAVNPLARVMSAADAVAEGDFSVQVPEVGPPEFARLAHSFNHMVQELQRLDQLRRNLMADVAHELRTPLHIIQGNIEGMQDGIYQPNAEQYDLLLSETRQLSRLIEDLRTLSLVEAGQLPLEHEKVRIADLMRDTATSYKGQLETAGIQLALEIPGDSENLGVQGDAGRFSQVLDNLVANAIRHTPPGGTISLKAWMAEDRVRIQVSDNGKGIPAEDIPNIFDRFWRGDASREDSTGLGLAIARQLVQAHGGTISVVSEPGKGTTFTIELPQNAMV